MIALPLVQIGVGALAAFIIPHVTDFHIESELFLVLFIAPLLFNEARNSDKRALWRNKWSILSLAIGLVLATVLVVGYTLNIIVPSIPLAAAFALGGALGPTDAAAVLAMGSSARLTEKQETQLSGESLINDASGVVSYHFAIAAAVTGTFSIVEAAESFGILFIGGILFGTVLGLSARYGVGWLREHGFGDTRLHVVYEVFTPFAVFLAAEYIGVSGILAVVACGLVMAESPSRIISGQVAKNIVVSNSVWKVIVFLINGVIFVLLGMQLPLAFKPSAFGNFSTFGIIALILTITALIVMIRFVWVLVMEVLPKRKKNSAIEAVPLHEKVHEVLITTLAGPKGSVTLSIIFTIPLTVSSGTIFPSRELIIFLAAGVILCSLILANIALPLLSRSNSRKEDDRNKYREASIKVLEATIDELVNTIRTTKDRELVPAMRITIAAYRARLARERFREKNHGHVIADLEQQVLEVQQARADELDKAETRKFTPAEAAYYAQTLRIIRISLGYSNEAIRVGSRPRRMANRIALLIQKFRLWLAPNPIESAEIARIYYEACIFEVELEKAARRYLEKVIKEDDPERSRAAKALYSDHRAAIESIWGRLVYMRRAEEHDGSDKPFSPFGKDDEFDTSIDLPKTETYDFPEEPELAKAEQKSFRTQFDMARHYADMADAWALTMELEQIQRLYSEGEIDEETSRALRTNVYNMQMAL